MFRKRQKVSYHSTYHKPSFAAWVRYTKQAKSALLLTFMVMFGSVGYLMLQPSSAESCDGLNIPVNSSPETNSQFHININNVGQGSSKTPTCLSSSGTYRLTFEKSNNSNYTFDFWRLNKDGTTSSSPQITFAGGTYARSSITLGLKSVAPPPPPQAPSVSVFANATSVKQNAGLTISWSTNNATSCTASGTWAGQTVSASSGSANRTGDTATTGTKTYKLTCQNSNKVTGSGTATVTVTANTTAQPPPPPPSTPSSPPSTPSTPSSRTTVHRPAATPAPMDTAPVALPVDTSDKVAPGAPSQFTAQADEETGFVVLGWLPASDNVAVSRYALERSTDQQIWDTLTDQFSTTAYTDNEVTFLTKYFYRVKAIDTNGNESAYVTTDVTTTAFVANVTAEQGGTFGTDDDWLAVKVPAQAVSENVQCAIRDDTSLPPSQKDYTLFAGPYSISCKAEDGKIISAFESDAIVTIKLDSSVQKAYNDMRFYTGSEGQWQQADAQVKGDTVSFAVKDGLLIAGIGRKKGTSIILKIIIVILVLSALAGAVLGLLYLRYKRQQSAQYDDYYRQQYGI